MSNTGIIEACAGFATVLVIAAVHIVVALLR
jgi:hypothetical protein